MLGEAGASDDEGAARGNFVCKLIYGTRLRFRSELMNEDADSPILCAVEKDPERFIEGNRDTPLTHVREHVS